MVQINFALKEVNCKIVYYGPGLSGKTTNLEVVHSKAPGSNCGELTSIATEGDRTLLFDFLPLNLGEVAGMTTKFQIYTVPGQVYYNSTRKLVLQGADGIAFVADSRKGKMDENLESLSNLEENLREYGMDINTIPLVLQYNKRDLPDIYSVDDMNAKMNRFGAPCFEAVALTGDGVFLTLKKLSSMVLESLNRQQSSTIVSAPKKKKTPSTVKPRVPAHAAEPVPVVSGSAPEEYPRSHRSAPTPRQSAARTGSTGRNPRAKAGDSQARIARAPVVNSPDVKPVEKTVLSPRAPRSPARQQARRAGSRSTSRNRGVPLKVWLLIVTLLGIAAAIVYFSGALKALGGLGSLVNF